MKKKSGLKTVLNILIAISFLVYLFALYYFTIGKSAPAMMNGEYRRVNLVPFKTISSYLSLFSRGRSSVAFLNLFGNIILFIPMGLYLPYFFKFLRKLWKDTLAVLLTILLVEGIEYVTGRGSLDVDDVILNLLGAIIAYGIWCLPFIQKIVRALEAEENDQRGSTT